ncbi:hypothetical protein ABIA32_005857 [Streptacidiphilus sp. MAP12-20]|uniref:DUF4118 domain-containing protein n=1 Tax=Streptacidiphilus sp. MAP12-20 TaxID=3156299 RepID=UPI0035189AFA
MPRYLVRGPVPVIVGIAAPLAVCAVLLPWRAHLSNTDVALVLVVAVVAVAVLGSRIAGALSALSAALWFDFFFTVPYQRFTISKSSDVTTAVLLLAVGLVVSQLAVHARRMRVIAVTDAGYLAQIHDTAQLAQSSASPDAVIAHVSEQLIRLLQARSCRFEYGSLLGHPPRLDQDGSILLGRRVWDVDRAGLPDEELELRAFASGRFVGRFMIRPTPGATPSLQARLTAVTLADHAGSALDSAERPNTAR